MSRNVRPRTHGPTHAIPFAVIDTLAHLLGPIGWVPAYAAACNNRALYHSMRAYYIARSCPNPALIVPGATAVTVAQLYAYMCECTSPLPVFAHLLWVVGRNVEETRTQLLDDSRLGVDLRMLKAETRLRGRLDEQSYAAADAIRRRIAAIMHVPLGVHAQEHDIARILQGTPATGEVERWLQWMRRYGEHVAFGRVCLSVTCRDNHFCSGARERACVVQPVPTGHSTHGGLPTVLWRHVLSFIPAHSMCSLRTFSALSRVHYTLVCQHPMGAVAQHAQTAAQLESLTCRRLLLRQERHMAWQAPCTQAYDPYSQLLRELLQAFRSYMNAFRGMRHAQLRHPPEECQSVVQRFIECATEYTGSPMTRAGQESVLKMLRSFDFILLDTFATDVLEMENQSVHALPPRAFWEGSKHRKGFRREFSEPDCDSPHRGAQIRYRLQCMREDLRQGRGAMLLGVRGVEAFEVAHMQRLMEELSDSGLVAQGILHPCAALSGTCNALLSHAELNGITQELVTAAEKDGDEWMSVFAAVHRLRMILAERMRGLAPAALSGLRVVPRHGTFPSWRAYLSKLSKERARVSMRLVTALDDGKIAAGFSVYYENRPSMPSSSSAAARADVSAIVPLHCLAVHGMHGRWPPRSTVADADVLIVWGGDGQAIVTLGVHGDEVFPVFAQSENNLVATLKRHGQLTGKCAPCGRMLRNKDSWIGSTCVGHLPEGLLD